MASLNKPVSHVCGGVELDLLVEEPEKGLEHLEELFPLLPALSPVGDQIVAVLLVLVAHILKHPEDPVRLLQLVSECLTSKIRSNSGLNSEGHIDEISVPLSKLQFSSL